jgi:acetoin utilization deacetylase AcuC-like enzyme
MHAYYADHFVLPLPEGHRFPMRKYSRLRDRLTQELPGVQMREAPAASDGELALVHTPAYIQGVATGSLDAALQREIGFPWSPAMAERARRSVGATVAAARDALGAGRGGQPGWRHAPCLCAQGRGLLCVQRHRRHGPPDAGRGLAAPAPDIERGCDRPGRAPRQWHRACVCQRPQCVHPVSAWRKNFPFRKEPSDLDVGLPDGCTDEPYLAALHQALQTLQDRFDPQLVIYLAGADPHEGDRLGRLKLTMDGMQARDRVVMDWAWQRRLPVVLCMGGGYGHDIETTVQVQMQTWDVALGYWQRWHNLGR